MKQGLIARVWGPGGLRLLAGDCAVVGLLAAGVIVLAGQRAVAGRPGLAEVQVAGRPAVSLDLSLDAVSEVVGPLGTTRIEVRGGRVRVLSSPCPLQACGHPGWVGAAGDLLVCLPNQVVVRLRGRPPAGPDAVSR